MLLLLIILFYITLISTIDDKFLDPNKFCFQFLYSPACVRCREQIRCLKERKFFATSAKKLKQSKSVPEEKDYVNIMWWKEVVYISFITGLIYNCGDPNM